MTARMMGVICAAFVLALSAGADDALLSRKAFADQVEAEIKKAHPGDVVVRVDADTIGYGGTEDAPEQHVFIDNSYRLYQDAPGDKDLIISRMISVGLLASEADETNIAERLVVVLRPSDYGRESFNGKTPETVRRPLAEGVDAILMLDSPETLSSVSVGQLKENNIHEDKAFDLAAVNLKRRMGEIIAENYHGIGYVSADSGLATGLVWMPETCAADSPATAFFVMNRNTFLTVPLDDADAMQALSTVAANMIEARESLTDRVLFCDSGTWVSARPRTTFD